MAFQAACHSCSTTVNFTTVPTDERLCPQCGTPLNFVGVTIPEPEPEPEPESVIEHAAEDDEPPRRRRRRRVIALLIGALVIAGSSVALTWALRPKPPTETPLTALDFGPWPEVKPLKVNDPQQLLTLHIETPDALTLEAVRQYFHSLEHYRSRSSSANWLRLTVQLYPVPDVAEFVATVNFGRVHRVTGQTVVIEAQRWPGLPGPEADKVEIALFRLRQPNNGFEWHEALTDLNTAAPDHRRPEVRQALKEALKNEEQAFFHHTELIRALVHWADEDDAALLLPLLDEFLHRHEIITLFKTFRKPETIRMLLNHALHQGVRQILIGMGPRIEPEVLALLAEDPQKAESLAGLLAHVGTKASIQPLEQLLKKKLGLMAENEAFAALVAIRLRTMK